jgi:hypothetical protein
VTLYSISKRAYSLIASQFKIPLPSVATVKRWLQRVDIKPGELMKPIMYLLQSEFVAASYTERICALSFDEVEISKKYCYDDVADQVLGNKKTVCVMSIRGLFRKWKQVIYFDWEKAPTSDDILNIIWALSTIGIDVRAMVSDMGPKNTGIWSSLDLGKVKNGVINRT